MNTCWQTDLGKKRTKQKMTKHFVQDAVWPHGFVLLLNLWTFASLKICPNLPNQAKHNFAKSGKTQFCQITNQNKNKIFPKTVKICQSGEISPNLVTLWTKRKDITLVETFTAWSGDVAPVERSKAAFHWHDWLGVRAPVKEESF